MKLRRTTLGQKVSLAMVAVITLVLLGVMTVVLVSVRQHLDELRTKENLQVADARADQVGQLFQLVQWQLKRVADQPAFLSGQPSSAAAAVQSLEGKLSPQVLQLLWADARGDYITSAGARGNIAERSYFRAVVGEARDWFVSEAVVSKSLGVPIIVVAIPTHDARGAVTGVLGAMISLKELSEIASDIHPGETGYGWITDGTGLIIAHPTAAAVMALNVTKADQEGYRGLDALGRRMVAGEHGMGEFTKPNGESFTTYFSPIEGSPGWTLGLSLTTEEVSRSEVSLLATFGVVLALAILVGVAISWALGRQLSRPLRSAAQAFRSLAEGDADLSQHIEVATSDEVGQLITEFNAFLAKLRSLVLGVKDVQATLTVVSEDLLRSAQSTLETSHEVSARVVQIQDGARGQSQNVHESSSAVEEVAKNIEGLDRLIVSQSASLTQASASVEQLIGTMGSIRNSSERMNLQFQTLVKHAAEGHETHGRSMVKIQAMSEQSERLLEANRIIADIAAQTNLLAMNAAIEAAHAGAAGRGFSVVADEIRKLAETSSLQSRLIGKDLKEIQAAILEALEASRASEASLDRIQGQTAETEVIVRGVFSALEEQQEGSSQILEALREIHQVSAEVRGGSAEMRQGNAMILDEIGHVRAGSVHIESAVAEVGAQMTGLSEAGTALQDLVRQTSDAVAAMEGYVGKFRV